MRALEKISDPMKLLDAARVMPRTPELCAYVRSRMTDHEKRILADPALAPWYPQLRAMVEAHF